MAGCGEPMYGYIKPRKCGQKVDGVIRMHTLCRQCDELSKPKGERVQIAVAAVILCFILAAWLDIKDFI